MKYTYDVIAKAKWNADEKINDILSPILKQFDTETKKIVNELCESNIFNNEEEKLKLIEKFEDTKSKMDNSEYSEYIKMDFEIDGCFFFVNYHISKVRFADDQRRKIMRNITIEL
jgi:hypothetical protein